MHGTSGSCEKCHSKNFNKKRKRRGPEGQRAPTRSKVKIRELCKQQKWKCSLCGKLLEQQHPKNHPMRITVDHVIPVSLGGSHDLHNLAAAHRICNIKKGNRSLGPEQLRMIA
jgi:5-methylcytosine-specific restriction endonuclease McrA